MTLRVSPWNRFLRCATRTIAASLRTTLLAFAIGAPFAPEARVSLAIVFTAAALVLALRDEIRQIRQIEEAAPSDFGPGQVRISRPINLNRRSRLHGQVYLHFFLVLPAIYAALANPYLAAPAAGLWSLSLLVAAFRYVAFNHPQDIRMYVVVPLEVWEQAQGIYARQKGRFATISTALSEFREQTNDWPIPPHARLLLISLASVDRDQLLIETEPTTAPENP